VTSQDPFERGRRALRRGDLHGALSTYADAVHATRGVRLIEAALSRMSRASSNARNADAIAGARRYLVMAAWLRKPPSRRARARSTFETGPALRRPVLIVAGEGADPPKPTPALAALRQALAAFRGTILSGGTKTGVSGIVAGLASPRGAARARTVGYAPSSRSPHVRSLLDHRYDELVETSGGAFSALEALVYWEHLLAAGHRPRDVRLVGCGGGQISACEYRIALSFGARVGLVAGSGRFADALLTRRDGRRWTRLRRLEPTAASITRFIGGKNEHGR
jgi:hypothetical protein